MAREKLCRRECDGLDVAAVWPCSPQIGYLPIPYMDAGLIHDLERRLAAHLAEWENK